VGFCPRSLRHLAADLGYEVVELTTYRCANDLPARRSLLGRLEALATAAILTIGPWIGSGAGIAAWLRRPEGTEGPK